MQYTIRQIPRALDRALRSKAKAEGKSLNQVAVEVMSLGAGVTNAAGKPKRDLSFMRMHPADIEAIRKAHEEFDQVDEEMWR